MTETIPTLILCGGQGTRLREETEYRPKPMVEVGGRPLLWHIMRLYAAQGFKEFVLLTGYRGDQIKHYFLNYEALHRDFTVTLGPGGGIEFHDAEDAHDWRVTIADTGASTMTGARIKRAARYVRGDRFMLTYGELEIDGARVRQFNEKPQLHEGLINGGFFVFERGFLDYLSDDPGCVLERGPLERLAADGQLSVYRHEGFWQSMDTYRDYQLLNQLWDGGNAPWAPRGRREPGELG